MCSSDPMDYLPELKGITLKPCEHCFAVKEHRVAFRTHPPRRAENVLDRVHTDVFSMTEKSISGALYFVTFIDDHSRNIFLYVLKNKWQVLDVFKEFHASFSLNFGVDFLEDADHLPLVFNTYRKNFLELSSMNVTKYNAPPMDFSVMEETSV